MLHIIARRVRDVQHLCILARLSFLEFGELSAECFDTGMRIQSEFLDLLLVFFFRILLIENAILPLAQINAAGTVKTSFAIEHEITVAAVMAAF